MALIIPTVIRDGDEFCYWWKTLAIVIAITNLKDGSSDFTCEIAVQIVSDDGTPLEELLWQKLNLSASRTRQETANTLNKKGYERYDWWLMLDYVARTTVAEYRRGEPTIDLATVETTMEPSYLVARMVPENDTTVLYADGGSGKSFLAMALAIAVRTGIGLPCGLTPTHQTSILYVDYETTRETHARRLRRLAYGMGLRSIPSVHYRRPTRTIMEDAPAIRAEMSRLKIGLVVIDSLLFALGDDPLKAGVAIQGMNAIRSLGSTRLVISHISRESQNNGAIQRVDPFGSVMFRNAARSAWEMRKSNQKTGLLDIGLFNRKSNDDAPDMDPIGLRLEFEPQGGPVRISDIRIAADPELRRFLPVKERLEELLSNGAEWALKDLAFEASSNETTVKRTIEKIANVVQVAGGKGRGNASIYQLRDPATEALPWLERADTGG